MCHRIVHRRWVCGNRLVRSDWQSSSLLIVVIIGRIQRCLRGLEGTSVVVIVAVVDVVVRN